MKLKHNKKRNTAFLYEVLIKELSKASMNNLNERKNKVINILKSFFSKTCVLREELEIYQSFEELQNTEVATINKIIFESRIQAAAINKEASEAAKSKMINLINKELGQASWETFIKDYKKMATINQVVFSKTSPKKQIFLENKLLGLITKLGPEKKTFPNVNNLALSTFLEKFNREYSETLNENQKELLSKYITSFQDDGLEMKTYLYLEIARLKDNLQEHVEKEKGDSSKLRLVLEKMKDYSNRRVDKNMITEIIKIQSLVGELKDGTNNKN
tara:strand:+ start:413 stop:1234 length:822 start_codon:yes stop_codon:yes gene_type:complete